MLLGASRVARVGWRLLEAIGRSRLGWPTPQAHASLLAKTAAELCRVHGFEVRVTGALPAGPAVLIANHVSYVDPMVIASLTPCVPIAKGEIAGWPVIGSVARSLGVVFVERGDAYSGARVLRAAIRSLEAGVSVLGFPEGTTSWGHGVLPFRRGLFSAARLARVPLVPIAISYSSPDIAWVGDDWFLPHYLRTAAQLSTTVLVEVGKPVASHSVGSAEDLAHVLRGHIGHMLWRPSHEPAARDAVPAPRPDALLSVARR